MLLMISEQSEPSKKGHYFVYIPAPQPKKICLSRDSDGYCKYIRCPSGGGCGPGPNPPNFRCIENCERSFPGNGTRMLELRVNKVTGAAQDFQHSKIQDQRQNGV